MSTVCGPGGARRGELGGEGPGGVDALDGEEIEAELIEERDEERPGYTVRCDVDCHGALSRGLAQYLARLRIEGAGRDLSFNLVTYDLPDVEVSDRGHPTAAVWSDADGIYDASNLSPALGNPIGEVNGMHVVLRRASEFVLPLKVSIWATDKVERQHILREMENSFSPVEWMNGFWLRLPFYFNATATYALQSSRYDVAEERVMAGLRIATLTVEARIPVLAVRYLPMARPRSRPGGQNGSGVADCLPVGADGLPVVLR